MNRPRSSTWEKVSGYNYDDRPKIKFEFGAALSNDASTATSDQTIADEPNGNGKSDQFRIG